MDPVRCSACPQKSLPVFAIRAHPPPAPHCGSFSPDAGSRGCFEACGSVAGRLGASSGRRQPPARGRIPEPGRRVCLRRWSKFACPVRERGSTALDPRALLRIRTQAGAREKGGRVRFESQCSCGAQAHSRAPARAGICGGIPAPPSGAASVPASGVSPGACPAACFSGPGSDAGFFPANHPRRVSRLDGRALRCGPPLPAAPHAPAAARHRAASEPPGPFFPATVFEDACLRAAAAGAESSLDAASAAVLSAGLLDCPGCRRCFRPAAYAGARPSSRRLIGR